MVFCLCFKQKMAYEMRIRDGSSDVWSSDVGKDAQGNVYYEAKKGGRRWVIYNGPAEASRVPPEWHGWLHRTTDVLPEDAPIQPKSWEKPHVPNMTGTALAYAPQGSLKIGRASCRERVGQYVSISVGARSLKKKN